MGEGEGEGEKELVPGRQIWYSVGRERLPRLELIQKKILDDGVTDVIDDRMQKLFEGKLSAEEAKTQIMSALELGVDKLFEISEDTKQKKKI